MPLAGVTDARHQCRIRGHVNLRRSARRTLKRAAEAAAEGSAVDADAAAVPPASRKRARPTPQVVPVAAAPVPPPATAAPPPAAAAAPARKLVAARSNAHGTLVYAQRPSSLLECVAGRENNVPRSSTRARTHAPGG